MLGVCVHLPPSDIAIQYIFCVSAVTDELFIAFDI